MLSAERTLRAVSLFFALAVGYAVYNGVSWVRFQQQTLSDVAAEERSRYETIGAQIPLLERGDSVAGVQPWTDPRFPQVAGGSLATRYAALPPAALASLAVGQSDLYPYYARVSTRTKQTFIVNDEIENPVNLMAGRFDLSFVVIYLYPLLILALAYNLVSAEREQGTLAILMSQPVRARRVMVIKILVRAVIVVSLALGFTLLAALVAGVPLLAPGSLPRLALWAGIVTLYGVFWFSVALAVNALGKSSATNAVILLGAWLAVVVLVPAVYNVVVTTVIPSPSRIEMTQALREGTNAAQARGEALLQKYYIDHPEMMPGGDADMENFAARSIAVQEEVERDMAPTLAGFDQRLVEQQALADRYRFVSPAIVTQAALYDVAGTGAGRYRHFQLLVDDYHTEWRSFFYPRIFAKDTLGVADYERLPRFEYREEPLPALMRRVIPGLGWLLVPTLAIGALGIAGLRRVSPAEG